MASNDLRGTPEPDFWEIFDGLPEPFRHLLRTAHTNYKAGWVRTTIRGFGAKVAFDVVRQRLWDARRKDIRTHYGPNHPELRR